MKLPRLRLGLLARVALALAMVGLLPVAISWFGLVDVNREALYEQVLRTHILAARTGSARVESFLSTRTALARAAAANPALADPRSPAARGFLLENLQAWAGLGVAAVAVVNAQGEEVIRAQLKGEEGVRRRVAAALGLRAAAPVAVVPGEGPPWIRIRAPLPGGSGALLLVCDAAALADVVHPPELGDQAELLVADSAGRVVLGSAASLRGLPPALLETALAGKLEGSGRFALAGGGEVLAAYAAIPGAGWTVLSRQPAVVAEAVAARLRQRSVLAIGAALLLIAGLSAAAYATVVRPIRSLVAAQRALGGPEGAAAGGGNEIQALRATFDALRRSLFEKRALDNVFLGRYKVLDVLGTGGMGTVFRGWDPRLQRPVALKTIRLGTDLPPEKRRDMFATLLREAVTVARFSHPNVVAIYDLEDAPEAAFVAMELVEGMSLERLLFKQGRLSPDRVVALGAAVARGLAAAHERGIIHRDVKPANVLLGNDGSIKVADFGIADLVSAAAPKHDVIFGTPGYLAPELLRGEGYTAAGDLFALGVMLYECLTGMPPFQGLEVSDLVHATLFGPIRPLRQRVPAIPPMLDSLVVNLLERDVALRPSNAAAVAAELEGMGGRWSLEPSPGSAAQEPEKVEVELAVYPRTSARWVRTTRVTSPPRPSSP